MSAAKGHMPFVGHRTVAQVWAQQTSAKRVTACQAMRTSQSVARAMEFGFDPESLKACQA